MIKKVAESQVLRKAFNIHGVYCPEEMGAGYVTEGGDIVTQSIEAEFTRIGTDKSHLTIVKPPQAEHQVTHTSQDRPSSISSKPPVAVPPPLQPVSPAIPEPAVIEYEDDDGWPDLPQPQQEKIHDEEAQRLMALLDAKHVSYDTIIEGCMGFISAKSYEEKELLKASGFRWSADTKRWVYKFQNMPF